MLWKMSVNHAHINISIFSKLMQWPLKTKFDVYHFWSPVRRIIWILELMKLNHAGALLYMYWVVLVKTWFFFNICICNIYLTEDTSFPFSAFITIYLFDYNYLVTTDLFQCNYLIEIFSFNYLKFAWFLFIVISLITNAINRFLKAWLKCRLKLLFPSIG